MRHTDIHNRPSDNGFTLFEVLLVIAMVAFVTVMAAPFLSGSLSRGDLSAATDRAADALKEARASAMSGRATGEYGVHFETGGFTLFQGQAYSAVDPGNVVYDLSGLVSVSVITVEGGGNDILFTDPSGSPTDVGTVQLSDSTGETAIISVNRAGMIDVQ